MPPVRRHQIFISLVLLLCTLTTALALEVPPLRGRINDYAGMLSAQTARALEQKLAAFERDTSNQVVLLTIPSLQDETIEGFAIKVGDTWKIGQKDKGNGVMLILAKKERKIRIEVGTGLQGALPDITAGQIIRNVMAPHLRSGNFDAGISAGLDAIIAATRGEFKAPATDKKTARKKTSSNTGLFIILILAGIALVAAAGAASRTAGTLAGGVALPLAAGIGGLSVTLGKLGILAILGAAAGFLISLLMRLFRAAGGGRGGGGYGGGGPTIFWGGSGGGFSSSGGDSFEGGGGDFDGGGSSDNW